MYENNIKVVFFALKIGLTNQSHYVIMYAWNHIIDVTDKKVVHTIKPNLIKVSALLHHPIKTTKWA